MYRTLSDFVIGETNTDKQLAASTGIAESHDYLIGLVSYLVIRLRDKPLR